MCVQEATRSPYTGTPQVSSNPWHGYFTLSAEHVPIVREANVRPWRAFFAKVNGQENWFKFKAVEERQTHTAHAAKVYGNGQALPRRTLRIELVPNVVGFPGEGMLATVQNQLLMITAVALVPAEGAGVRDLTFNFPLRDYAADETLLELTEPYGVFMFDDPRASFPEPGTGQQYNFSIEATDVGRVIEE
jgi:hypothetical protein